MKNLALAIVLFATTIPAFATPTPLLGLKCIVMSSTDEPDHQGYSGYSVAVGEIDFADGESGTKSFSLPGASNNSNGTALNQFQAQRLLLSNGSNYIKVWVDADQDLVTFPAGPSAEGDNYVTLRFRVPSQQPTPNYSFFCSPNPRR